MAAVGFNFFNRKKLHFCINTAQKMKFSIKEFFSKCDQMLNRKLNFLCSVDIKNLCSFSQ